MPELSVLMPVHDGARTIDTAIRSTLRALGKDAELVVYDDGSADGTAHVVESIHDKRVRLIDGVRRVGQGLARRKLVEATDSEFVACMDADDVCLPWRFAIQIPYLKHKRSDIVFSSMIQFRRSPLRIRPSMPLRINAEAMPLHLAVMCMVTHSTMVATRSSIEAAGGYRSVRAEDYDLWLRACTAGLRLSRLATPTVAYRRHAQQISFNVSSLDGQIDPELVDAYGRFLETKLGVRANWRDRGLGDTRSQETALQTLRSVIEGRGRGLSPLQRRLVQRTVDLLPRTE